MSVDSRDPRLVLVRDKYFSLRPKPLERWLWQQEIPQAAERVFWMHWEEGMRRGDWCSELSLKQVARECAVDPSTVTRAYQVLKALKLLRRAEPGRDPQNPFRQAIAITEVLVPRDLLMNLGRTPNRSRLSAAATETQPTPAVPGVAKPAPDKATPRLSRAESVALMKKLSCTEQAEFYKASQDRRTSLTFDPDSALSPEERGRVIEVLTSISNSTPSPQRPHQPSGPVSAPPPFAKPRRLSPLEAARIRTGVNEVVPAAEVPELFRQVLWSIEEGALRRFDARLALNIALKKIREGAWTRPNRLPPNWLAGARAETCSAA